MRNQRAGIPLLLGLGVIAGCSEPSPPPGLVLELRLSKTEIHIGETTEAALTLANQTDTTVTVISWSSCTILPRVSGAVNDRVYPRLTGCFASLTPVTLLAGGTHHITVRIGAGLQHAAAGLTYRLGQGHYLVSSFLDSDVDVPSPAPVMLTVLDTP